MTRKGMALASILLVLLMAASSLYAGLRLPADAQLPVHWNLWGEPDRFAGKWFALAMPLGIASATALLLYFLPELEPRSKGLTRSQGLYLWSWAGTLLMFGAVQIAVLDAALGLGLSIPHVIVGALGLMLALIGNQLGKSRSMFLVGIRTPWTLASEEIWIRTHRLGGKLLAGGGVILLLAALLGVPPWALALLTGLTLLFGAVLPAVYSFLLWRIERRAAQPRE